MSLQQINTGTLPNDATGDPLQTAFNKCNANFTTLNALGVAAATPSSGWGTPINAGVLANFAGSSATLAQTGEVVAELIILLKAAGLLAT